MTVPALGWPSQRSGALLDLKGEHVLVPLPDDDRRGHLLAVGGSLAAARGADLLAVEATGPSADRSTPSRLLDSGAERTYDLVTYGVEGYGDASVLDRRTVRIDRGFDATLGRLAGTDGVDLLVGPAAGTGALHRSPVERAAARADCDVVLAGGPGVDGAVASLLLPVAGGPHSDLAVEVARALALTHDAWVDVLHVVDGPDAGDAEALVAETVERLEPAVDADEWLLEASDPAEAVVESSRCYDATVLGAPTKGRLREFVFGSTTGAVRSNARCPVLMARRGDGPD